MLILIIYLIYINIIGLHGKYLNLGFKTTPLNYKKTIKSRVFP